MASKRIVTGLDVGTTKVCTCVGEIGRDGKLSIIGVGTTRSRGLRKGMVVDLERTVEDVTQSVQKAEQMAGVEVGEVYLGVAGGHITSFNSGGVIAISGAPREVTPEDVERVVQAAREVPISQDREIIHVLAREFIVDGCRGIRDPVGMSAVRLEAQVHIITAAATSIQNLAKWVQRAGVAIADVVLQPLASSLAVLTPAERDLGVVLVDLGGGTTDVAVFAGGSVAHTAVIPVGGNHVTNDVAIGLQVSPEVAEGLKVRYGTALAEMVRGPEAMAVEAGAGRVAGNRSRLAEIIEPRVEEILQMAAADVRRACTGAQMPASAVLSGGTALMEGMVEAAQRCFGLPVRIGVPDQVDGLIDVVSSPVYATGVGLVQHGYRERVAAERVRGNGSLWGDMLERVRAWLNGLS